MQRDIGVHNEVVRRLTAQLVGIGRAVWVQRAAAVDVIAQVVLPHHLRQGAAHSVGRGAGGWRLAAAAEYASVCAGGR